MIRFERELHLVIILTLFLAGIVALGEGGWLQYIRVPWQLSVSCISPAILLSVLFSREKMTWDGWSGYS
ncbi:exported hypothetical protein [Syntrophaceticus schinkii]|uniref:Uncharacterized protein n=1 Tax=Syntrophaceticus schinkii TaxID=499207 RepID=A0A0B7MPA7_9FIRM|nr:exported hypothetical protein [Syntrophaceticus schinkii]